MMNIGVMAFERDYTTNKWMPFMAAMGFHIFLLMWDPTILKAGTYAMQSQIINVKMMDHLPVMEPVQPKPAPKPERKIEKKIIKKAHKSGLSLSAKTSPMPIMPHHLTAKPIAAPKPFVSRIEMPKFVPHETDEPIAASPLPGIAPAASHKAVNAFTPAPVFKGKSRGVRAEDIPFQLSERGSGITAGRDVVAIPIGEEKGDLASLPSAPRIPGALIGKKGVAGYRYAPGEGSGSGELASHDKSGHIGYYGAVKADTYIEGSLTGVGNGKGGKVVTGKGFEIGGPVGDRKITHRKLPEYPAWAEEQGISATVKIYFTVKSDGAIRSTMRILQSSGYAELDDLAKAALQEWRFSATSADSSESAAWGVITFRFTLA
jgi:TonB family protein